MKRVFDILLVCLAGLVLVIPVLLVAMAVRLTSKGPALYWSDRVGRNNMIFKMPKFLSRPEAILRLITSCNPGSWMGTTPLLSN